MSGPGLEELFDRYRKAGDLAALAEVFDRTADQLLKIAWHLSPDEAQAEDLVQSTFLAAIENPERFDASREFVPWLVGILTNKAQVARSLAARTPDPKRLAERSTEDPVDDTERRELIATVEGALERVPDAYRQVLRIHLAEGKGAEEIAHEVKRPAGTVRVQLHRGLKELRRHLPAGFALGGLIVLTAPRGLAAMRAHVLGRASALAKASVAGVACVSTAQIVGGVLVGKKIAVAVGVVLVATGALWLAQRKPAPAENLTVAQVATPAGLESAERIKPDLANESGPAQRESAAVPAVVAADDPYGSLYMEWSWADGTAAAGIGVGVAPMGEEQPTDNDSFDVTDEQGHITFDHLHEGTVLVFTDRTGTTQSLETSIVRGHRTSEGFAIPAGADVRGRVVDREGNPVAGADVWLTENSEPGSVVATSAADGSYVVRSVHISRSLFATADRKGSSRIEYLNALDPQSTGAIDLDLHLQGESGAIEGTVRDPDGKPISGAWVTARFARSVKKNYWSDWPPVWMATLPDGTFRFTGLHMGQAEVEAFAHGFAVQVEQTLIEEDRTSRVDIHVEKGFKVEGTVRTPEGRPVDRAYVHIGPNAGEEGYVWRCQQDARTNAEGRYHLDFVHSGKTRLGAESRHPGSVARAKTEITGRPGDHLTWDPVLSEGGKIVGRLVDEAGLPLEGWSVEAHSPVRLEYSSRSANTDAQGRFAIPDCPDVLFDVAAYPSYSLGKLHPQAGAHVDAVRPGKGEILLTVTAANRASVYLRGKVVDDHGDAVADAQISATNEWTSQSSRATTEKGDGSFQIGPMPSGRYTVHVSSKKFPNFILDPIEIAPDEQRDLGTIKLETRGRFELVLRREDGSTVNVPSPMLFKGRYAHRLPSDDGFTFRGEDLYPGAYTLFAMGQNVASEQRAVQISSCETAHLELRLRAGVIQHFQFLPPQGETAPNVMRVLIRDAESRILLDGYTGLNSASDGTRILSYIAGFAPGRYTYETTSKGWESTGSFEITDTSAPWAEINARLVRTP